MPHDRSTTIVENETDDDIEYEVEDGSGRDGVKRKTKRARLPAGETEAFEVNGEKVVHRVLRVLEQEQFAANTDVAVRKVGDQFRLEERPKTA